jgi:peptidoglycan/LPS O-acetylase OafA/YrhL
VVYGSRLSDAAGMWVFFAAGALLRLAAQRWPGRLFRTDVAVLLVSTYAVTISMAPTWTPWVAWLALPYAVLVIGLASTPVVRRAARFGDMSYGLYLWAFPVQQLVVHFVGVQRMLVDVPLVTALTLAIALVSWHLVEHPSLRLKDRLGARLAGPGSSARRPGRVADPVGEPAGRR